MTRFGTVGNSLQSRSCYNKNRGNLASIAQIAHIITSVYIHFFVAFDTFYV